MNGSSRAPAPTPSISRRVTAAKVSATLRHIQWRWAWKLPLIAWTMPIAVTQGHSSASTVNPARLGRPPCACCASDSADTLATSSEPAYSQPDSRCSTGQRRRSAVLSWIGPSSSASPARKKCSGTSTPEIANCAANGSPPRNPPYRYQNAYAATATLSSANSALAVPRVVFANRFHIVPLRRDDDGQRGRPGAPDRPERGVRTVGTSDPAGSDPGSVGRRARDDRHHVHRHRRVGAVLAQVVGQRLVGLLLALAEDLVVAPLQPRVAHQRVIVHRAFAHAVDGEQLGAHVHQLQAL